VGPQLTIVTPTFYPELIGTPLYVADLAQWFARNDWSVRVVTGQPYYPDFKRHEGFDRRRRTDRLGDVEIVRLPTIVPKEGRRSWRVASDLNFAIQGLARRRALTTDGPVLSVSPGTPWVARVGAALTRAANHVCLVHDVQSGLAVGHEQTALAKAIRVNEARSLNTAGLVAGLTPEMVDTLRTMGVSRPTEVLPLWSTVAPPETFPHLGAEVQYSGNFGEKQGVASLAQVASGLARADIPLRVRGTGPRFAQLLPKLREAAGPLLHVEQLVPHSELTQALARSPVHLVLQGPATGGYVMPSKALNVLACGGTVIAMADVDSPVDRLSRELEGLFVVPPGDAEAAVRAALEHLPGACLPATRRTIADSAARVFSRSSVLTRLADLLAGSGSGECHTLVRTDKQGRDL